MTLNDWLILAVGILVVGLLCREIYLVYKERKAGKSWGEIALDRLEPDFGGFFGGRRSRGRHDDDDADTPSSGSADMDFD